jgi:hypothetical protein
MKKYKLSAQLLSRRHYVVHFSLHFTPLTTRNLERVKLMFSSFLYNKCFQSVSLVTSGCIPDYLILYSDVSFRINLHFFIIFSNNLTFVSYDLYIDIDVLILTYASFSVAFILVHYYTHV